jgi:hypothetical protein
MQQGSPSIQAAAFSFRDEGHFHVNNILTIRAHQSDALSKECSSIEMIERDKSHIAPSKREA